MISIRRIEVPALAGIHEHLRDAVNRKGKPIRTNSKSGYQGSVVDDLVRILIEGGMDCVAPMPNPTVALTTAFLANANRTAIHQCAERVSNRPLQIMQYMMLTEHTNPDEVNRAADLAIRHIKMYPYLRTTNSNDGIRHYHRMMPSVKRCGEQKVYVHLHPEHPWLKIGGRDAEYLFVPLIEPFLYDTEAVIVWEHGSDHRCIPLWEKWAKEFPGRFYVTITPHHLLWTEDDDHGNVALTCRPQLKTEIDRRMLLELVGKRYPWVLAGSDFAYHPKCRKHVGAKKCACGVFLPHVAAYYAEALEKGGILSRPDGPEIYADFTSDFARKAFNLGSATRSIALEQVEWQVASEYKVGNHMALPPQADQKLSWRLAEE